MPYTRLSLVLSEKKSDPDLLNFGGQVCAIVFIGKEMRELI